MMGEFDMARIERELRMAGAPPTPPPAAMADARAAALRETPEVIEVRRRAPRRRWARPFLAAAVIAACAVLSLMIGVGGRGTPSVQSTVTMTGADGASGTIKFATAQGSTRTVVMRVSGLPPAKPGHYYELWMADSSAPWGLIAFNTDGSGRAVASTPMPSDFGWERCWVTEESRGATSHPVTVLDSSA
jgi:hypothetical protein